MIIKFDTKDADNFGANIYNQPLLLLIYFNFKIVKGGNLSPVTLRSTLRTLLRIIIRPPLVTKLRTMLRTKTQ